MLTIDDTVCFDFCYCCIFFVSLPRDMNLKSSDLDVAPTIKCFGGLIFLKSCLEQVISKASLLINPPHTYNVVIWLQLETKASSIVLTL